VAALHLAPAGLLDDRHDLSPVLVVAVTLGMVLHPAIEELGGPLGKTVLLNQPGRPPAVVSLSGGTDILRHRPTLPLPFHHRHGEIPHHWLHQVIL
jgi:hypothetical protein